MRLLIQPSDTAFVVAISVNFASVSTLQTASALGSCSNKPIRGSLKERKKESEKLNAQYKYNENACKFKC